MEYNSWSYLYPPRPDKAISKSFIHQFENDEWVAQYKMNGTCSVIGISPDRSQMIAMGRHKDEHKAWKPSTENLSAFQNLSGSGWYVFVAELLHSKGIGVTNTNYIHEILVADGQFLLGTTWKQRQEILQGLFETVDSGEASHTIIDDHTWLVRNHFSGFEEIFDDISDTVHEGLVFKKKSAKLDFCFKEASNSQWQLKCRKPMKNFSY